MRTSNNTHEGRETNDTSVHSLEEEIVLGGDSPAFSFTCLRCHFSGGENDWQLFQYDDPCPQHGNHDVIGIICPACQAETKVECTYPIEWETEDDEEEEEDD
jgi:hypothetical protein